MCWYTKCLTICSSTRLHVVEWKKSRLKLQQTSTMSCIPSKYTKNSEHTRLLKLHHLFQGYLNTLHAWTQCMSPRLRLGCLIVNLF